MTHKEAQAKAAKHGFTVECIRTTAGGLRRGGYRKRIVAYTLLKADKAVSSTSVGWKYLFEHTIDKEQAA
jgi:hypothetical protein